MSTTQKPYCLMPWLHFHVGDKGKVRACCVANIPYGNINEQNLEEIWKAESVQRLRQRFLAGEKDNRCATCIKLESAGGKSIRQETFERFPDFQVHESELNLPTYFDIRFSNVCNFRCRTCWHGASSKWFADAKALGRQAAAQAIIKNVKDFKDFIGKTGEALLKAEEIYFAGGEPLVTEEHYLLLQWLVDHGATQMRLRYNTNFSTLNFKGFDVLELWRYFPKVELMASIDATGDFGAYIRKEMQWDTIVKHRLRLNALPSVHFKLAPTVSVLNILHLPELYFEALTSGMIRAEDFYINILERPLYYNVQILPPAYKMKVKQYYSTFFEQNSLPKMVKEMFQECLQYMLAEDRHQAWPSFLKETETLDGLRGERLDQWLDFKV